MAEDCLFEKRADGVALITFNRPDSLNAMGGQLLPQLVAHLERCEGDAEIRCVALTGAGRGFCAGGDVKGFAASGHVGITREGLAQSALATSLKLHGMRKPTVALVNGPAAGAGMSLALACDLRFCSDQARFVTAFSKIGLSGDFGGSYFLQRLIGYGRALEAYLLAEPIDAARALELGIANHVVPHDELMARGLEYCARLAAGPTYAYGNIKAAFNFAESAPAREALPFEAGTMTDSAGSQDFADGAKAWAEGRKPEFRGR
jgi:2-(1,2-epoxy-1,2-dihydrophenyl)acetyl-CoA isomerase